VLRKYRKTGSRLKEKMEGRELACAPTREKTVRTHLWTQNNQEPGIDNSSIHRTNCLSHQFYLNGEQRCLNPNVLLESDLFR